jgi:ketosteroid isomerase-like protein
MPQQSDEAEIRAVIHAWTQGIAAKNTPMVVAQPASEVVQFDLAPPLRVNDADPEGLESWFATWRDAIGPTNLPCELDRHIRCPRGSLRSQQPPSGVRSASSDLRS